MIGIILTINYCNRKESTFTNTNKELIIKYDSLHKKEFILKDSIINLQVKVDSIIVNYEKDSISIINQPIDSDCIFFANYLSQNFK